jgi:hypothetical protein
MVSTALFVRQLEEAGHTETDAARGMFFAAEALARDLAARGNQAGVAALEELHLEFKVGGRRGSTPVAGTLPVSSTRFSRTAPAQTRARSAAVRVRNRESLMERLEALRGQYADDKKKLTFLKEAERLFNPLQVSVCPACLSALDHAPSIDGGACGLCGNQVSNETGVMTLGVAADAIEASADPQLSVADDGSIDHAVAVLTAELKATTRRLDELTDYWNRLDDDLMTLRSVQDAADRAVEEAAEALNGAADVPAPYLAGRDDLNRRRAEAGLRQQSAEAGLRLWARVQAADDSAQRLAGLAAQLRADRKDAANRPDRAAVVVRLSTRFGEILRATRNSTSRTSMTG